MSKVAKLSLYSKLLYNHETMSHERSFYIRFIKPILDFVGAIFGLFLILPLTSLIALAIKLESRGPVLVKIPRVSEGRVVKVWKFRSMVWNAEALKPGLLHANERKDGPFFKMTNDPRITRVGRVLRKFRLDEFPQLVNVLKGELSLVGPRPHEPQEVIYYPHPYKHLLLAKSGVTGLSQVNGASLLPFLKELELDSHYIQNQSLWFDLTIAAKTVKIIFTDPTAV